MKKLLCKLFGHKLVLEVQKYGIFNYYPTRLRCIRCGVCDPYRYHG